MKATIIFGGQFGSEGKGLLASNLVWQAQGFNKPYDLCTTDAGPNAGHTAIMEDGAKVVTFHLPMMGVLSPGALIWLNGGAIINPEILMREIRDMESLGFNIRERLAIHPNASLILPEDVEEEKDPSSPMSKISSTQKGVGAAAIRRMRRAPGTLMAKDWGDLRPYTRNPVHPSSYSNISVEVAQGHSLNINSRFYPYTTFRCCNPAQGLMNANIPTTVEQEVWAVIRVNPIRVGNLPDGYSGDVFDDQHETSWEALGQEPQYTTVTNRVRRVFTYSKLQVEKMIRETLPTGILINFAQTVPDETLKDYINHIYGVYKLLKADKPMILAGFGPKSSDVHFK